MSKSNPFRLQLLSLCIASCFACSHAIANPGGAQIVSGTVTITANGNILNITNSSGSIINWQSFSIAPGETTRFIQPSANSSVLNRVTAQNNPSQILGTLQSNGKVYLINPNGILFGAGSQVNVGGLVASTLNMSDADFLTGKNTFNAQQDVPIGSIINNGNITTPSGGNIYLIAPQIQNNGILTSPHGEILLAAGHSVQLVDSRDPALQVVISAPTDQALNIGKIIAQGGKIGIYGALVNQHNIVNADSAVVGQNGKVVLKSSDETILGKNSQTTALGAGQGGQINILGSKVSLTDNAMVNASGQTGGGTILIGGDFHGANPAVPNANHVFIDADADIRADAIQNGNGGKIAVWSENLTQFNGKISAKGGAQGGDGGFAEISSRKYLDFRGTANTLASKGRTGTLLLDPEDIYISGIDPNNGASFLETSVLVSALFTNNVQIATNNSLPGNGTITINCAELSPLTWYSANTLMLDALSDIYIDSPVTALNGILVLNSQTGNIDQTAPINVAALSATAALGNVGLTNAANTAGMISGMAGGVNGFRFASATGFIVGTVNSLAGIQTTNRAVRLTANTGDITVNELIDAGSGSINIAALSGSILQGNSANANIKTTRDLTLRATDGDIGGNGNVLKTEVSSLDIQQANHVFLNNSDTGNLDLNGITANGFVSVSTAGSLTIPVDTFGINNTAGNIALKANGDIRINSPIITSNNSIVALQSVNGAIGQQASITAGFLSAQAHTGVLLAVDNHIANASGIGTVAGTSDSGDFIFNNSESFNVGQVAAVDDVNAQTGITANGQTIALLSINGHIGSDAGATVTGSDLITSTFSGLGSQNTPFRTSVNNLVLLNGGSLTGGGDVVVFNTGKPLTIANITQSNGGHILVSADQSLTVNGAIITTNGDIQLTSVTGSILQGSNIAARITTPGALVLRAFNDVGLSGAGNALLTKVGSLDVQSARNVFLSNSGTDNLIISKILGSGVVNVSTAGSLTIPSGDGTTNFTGSSINLVAGRNLLIGNGNVFSAANGAGVINLFAGYDQTPGFSPVANGSASTLTEGGTINAAFITLFANTFDEFLGNATHSSISTYCTPTSCVIRSPLPTTNYIAGLNPSIGLALNDYKNTGVIQYEPNNVISCN